MIEEIENVPPCKILWSGGRPVRGELVITERKRTAPNLLGFVIPPSLRTPFVPRVVRPQGRPPSKIRAIKAKRGSHAWNKKEEMTIKGIIALQTEGKDVLFIAHHFGVGRAAVHKRLRLARKSDPALAAQEESRRICHCGKKKWANRERVVINAGRN